MKPRESQNPPFSHPWFFLGGGEGGVEEVGGDCRLGRKTQKKRNLLFSCKSMILKKLSIVYPDRSYSTNWEKKVFKDFSALISVYLNNKSAIKIDNKLTQSFPCHFEVKQGCTLLREFTPVPSARLYICDSDTTTKCHAGASHPGVSSPRLLYRSENFTPVRNLETVSCKCETTTRFGVKSVCR